MESIGIGALAAAAGVSMDIVRYYERKASAKLADVDRRLEELKRIRKGLFQLVEHCPGHGSPDDCPIIQALSGGAS